jgi:hypothetical protein
MATSLFPSFKYSPKIAPIKTAEPDRNPINAAFNIVAESLNITPKVAKREHEGLKFTCLYSYGYKQTKSVYALFYAEKYFFWNSAFTNVYRIKIAIKEG